MISAIASIFLSAAATSPGVYEFRNYTSSSSCTEVQDTELANGGVLIGSEVNSDNGHVRVDIDANVYGYKTRIRLHCLPDEIPNTIGYTSEYEPGIELEDIFRKFYAASEEAFGVAEVTEDRLGKAATFLCKEGVLIQLILESSNAIQAVMLVISSGNKRCM